MLGIAAVSNLASFLVVFILEQAANSLTLAVGRKKMDIAEMPMRRHRRSGNGRRIGWPDTRNEFRVPDAAKVHVSAISQVLDAFNHHFKAKAIGRGPLVHLAVEMNMFRPDSQDEVLIEIAATFDFRHRAGRKPSKTALERTTPAPLNPPPVQEIHRRPSDEPRHESVGRPPMDLGRRADLLDATVIDHRQSSAQGHGLFLIVGHVHGGHAPLGVDPLNLPPKLAAKVGIQMGERFIQEQNAGRSDEGPCQCHALPLASGELVRSSLEQAVDSQPFGRVQCKPPSLPLGNPPRSKRKGKVAQDG